MWYAEYSWRAQRELILDAHLLNDFLAVGEKWEAGVAGSVRLVYVNGQMTMYQSSHFTFAVAIVTP